MVEHSTRPARVRRRIAVVAALASFVALLLALTPGTATAGLAGTSNLGVTGSGSGSGTIRAVQTIYGGNYQSGIACNWNGQFSSGVCTESVPFGEPPEPIVVFQAQAGQNSTFVQWAIQPASNIVSGCGTGPACYVQISGTTSVIAGFNSTPGIPLTVFRAGPAANTSGSTVTSTSLPAQTNQINCGGTCTQVFPQGTVVTLTAVLPTGVTFGGWSGTGVPAGCGTNPTCTFTLTAPLGVTATFNVATFPLTVVEVGQGGIISNVQPGIHCGDGGTQCTFNFASGSQVTLTATADSGYTLQSVSGGGCTGSPCTVTMNQAQNVTFTFASTTVQANVRNVSVTYNGPPNRQRAINATVNGQQTVTVIIRVVRQGRQVAQRTFNGVSGIQTLRVGLRNGLPAGSYTVRITFTNDSGNTKQAKPKTVRVRAV